MSENGIEKKQKDLIEFITRSSAQGADGVIQALKTLNEKQVEQPSVKKEKSASSWTEETCRIKSKMFYNNVGNRIVYVTVTIQDMPAAMEQYPSHAAQMTIGEFVQDVGTIIDEILREEKQDGLKNLQSEQ